MVDRATVIIPPRAGPSPVVASRVYLSSVLYSGNESDVIQFTINRADGFTQAVRVSWAVTGVTVSPSTGTVTFAAGEGEKVVSVVAAEVIGDETGTLILSDPTNLNGGIAPTLQSPSAATIEVNDVAAAVTLALGANSYSANEGGILSFFIERSGREGIDAVTVDWAIPGASVTPTSGTVLFEENDTQARVDVAAGDVEVNELSVLTLSNPQNLTGAAAVSLATPYTANITVRASTGDTYVATHYVAPWAQVAGATSDNDTTNGPSFASAVTPDNPCTIREALNNAMAGHRVRIAYGEYEIPTTISRLTPAYRASNAGTSGQRIIFFAENPATSTADTALRSKFTHTGRIENANGCPTLGFLNNSYVIFDGFWVDEATGGPKRDTGPSVFWGSNNCQLRRCIIEGADLDVPGSEWYTGEFRNTNHSGMRFEDSHSCTASDCIVRGITNPNNTNNASAIEFYAYNVDSYYHVVEYCEFEDCTEGYFMKGEVLANSGGNILRNSIFRRIDNNAIQLGQSTGTQYGRSQVYSCLLIDCQNGIMTNRYARVYSDIFNITIARCQRQHYQKLAGAPGDVTMRNIISYDNATHLYYEAIGDETWLSPDHNCYYTAAGDYWRYAAQGSGVTYNNFPDFQAAQAASWEANSINQNPLFTNSAEDDFTLASGSPCLGTGTDYLGVFGQTPNMGAFATATTTLGVRANPDYVQ